MDDLIKEMQKAIDAFPTMEDHLDFVPLVEPILQKIKERSDSFDAVGKILQLLEINEDWDYGGPGPIGHFLESFYGDGYEKLLVESLNRRPKEYTLFLLHRIINEEDNSKRLEYISLVKAISIDENLEEDLREEALEYLEDYES